MATWMMDIDVLFVVTREPSPARPSSRGRATTHRLGGALRPGARRYERSSQHARHAARR